MTDKIKRLKKILNKKGLKDLLKPVDNLENSQFVIVENKPFIYDIIIFETKEYKTLLERGENYSFDNVYFVINSNRRNLKNINNSFLKNRLPLNVK